MKTKDLMIGDWVQISENLVRIDEIYDCDILCSNGYIYSCSTQIIPIPITPDILKKNEFVECLESGHKKYYFYTEGLRIKIDFYGPLIRFIIIFGTDDSINNISMLVPNLYVHDIQHIFKLCKINKEIIL